MSTLWIALCMTTLLCAASAQYVDADGTGLRQEIREELKIGYKALTDELTSKIEDLKGKIDKLEDTVLQNKVALTSVVAFRARIAGFTGSASEDTPIPFDVVDLNIGSAYEPSTGIFTPPVDGLYEISYEVRGSNSICGDDSMHVVLYVNGVALSRSHSEFITSGGTALTLLLAAGDSVWMATGSSANCESLIADVRDNKFSGHLIYRII